LNQLLEVGQRKLEEDGWVDFLLDEQRVVGAELLPFQTLFDLG
jgi:hypothetical protein